MYSRLKSLKSLKISPNGCVYFDYSVNLKTFKKYDFLKKSLVIEPFNKKKPTLLSSNFYYMKYRN